LISFFLFSILQHILSEEEKIELSSATNVDAKDISTLTPPDQPRYHFFRYRHAFEDNTIESISIFLSSLFRLFFFSYFPFPFS